MYKQESQDKLSFELSSISISLRLQIYLIVLFIHFNNLFEMFCITPTTLLFFFLSRCPFHMAYNDCVYLQIMQMLEKSKSSFIKDYNHRLFNWLVAFSLFMVVVGRFVIKFILVEIGAWILFIFLETYTRMFWSAESLYYNPMWHFIVATWETLVYSPILDLDR